jgi:hypothetical protein
MENPSGVFVTFYTDAVELAYESEKQKRPIYKDVPFIRKMIPGDATNIIERAAKEADFKAYPAQWKAYQASQKTGEVVGTPLEQWPQVTRAQIKELKYVECHTVEQLAQMSDANSMKMGPGFRVLRESAQKWLESATNANADAEKEQLLKTVAELSQKVSALSGEDQKRSPGRPKREEVAA